jgi:predicted phosphodiesterase
VQLLLLFLVAFGLTIHSILAMEFANYALWNNCPQGLMTPTKPKTLAR